MLGVLLKNDIKLFWKRLSIWWAISGFICVSSLFFFPFIELLRSSISIIFVTTYTIAVIGLVYSPSLIGMMYFADNMYGNEGYLTHSIPTRTSTIVISKVITFSIFSIIGGLLGSIIYISWPSLFSIKNNLAMLTNTDTSAELNPSILLKMFVQLGIPLLLSLLVFTLIILFAQSLAQSMDTKKKRLAGIIIFIVIFLAVELISLAFFNDNVLLGGNSTDFSSPDVNDWVFNKFYIGQMVFNLVEIALLLVGVLYISSKKLRI